MTDYREQLRGLEQKHRELSDEILPIMERQRDELKSLGRVTEETRDDLMSYGKGMTELTSQLGALRSVVAEMEASSSASARSGGRSLRKSVAQRLVESDAYKAFKDGRSQLKSYKADVGPLWSRRAPAWETRDAGDVDASGIVAPQYQRPPLPIAQPRAVMRSLCTVIPTSETNQVKVSRQTVDNKIVAVLTAATASGNAVFTVDTVSGFSAGLPFNVITLDNGAATESLTIQSIDAAALTITTTTNSSINMAIGDKITGTAYTYTGEGLIAPRSSMEPDDLAIDIVDLTSRMTVNLNQLSDIPSLQNTIESDLLGGLGQSEDLNTFYAQKVSGSGMTGAFFDSSLSQLTWSAQAAGTSILDFILNGYYEVADANYLPDVTLVSVSVHKQLIQLRATDGHYLFWTAFGESGPAQVFATRLIWSNLLQPTHGIVGDFMSAFRIYDREEGSVEIGTPGDQFNARKRTLLAAERIGFGVVRGQAARWLIFDAAPAAP